MGKSTDTDGIVQEGLQEEHCLKRELKYKEELVIENKKTKNKKQGKSFRGSSINVLVHLVHKRA